MSRLILDLKVAARTAVRARFVSVLAVVAFALGIGVTTAVFSIFNGVLLAPLPFPHPEQLVMVYDTQPACATCPASFPKYHDWRERNQVFSAIGGASGGSFVMTGHGDPSGCARPPRPRRWPTCSASVRSSAAGTPRMKIVRAGRRSRCCRRRCGRSNLAAMPRSSAAR